VIGVAADGFLRYFAEPGALWVRGLLTEMTDGTLPGMAEWRQFHDTGEIPARLAELAAEGTDPR
jgi:hypothetical protein